MTNAQTEARAIARLRETLGGVCPDDFGGDNLAIFIAAEIEPQIEDETLDESGTWKQGAIDACTRVLDAIHAHYATALAAKDAELAAENERLKVETFDAATAHGKTKVERNKVRKDLEQAEILVSDLRSVIIHLEAQLAEAGKALEPFADIADTEDEVGRDSPDDDRVWVVQAHGCRLGDLTVEHFRAARRVLTGGKNG